MGGWFGERWFIPHKLPLPMWHPSWQIHGEKREYQPFILGERKIKVLQCKQVAASYKSNDCTPRQWSTQILHMPHPHSALQTQEKSGEAVICGESLKPSSSYSFSKISSPAPKASSRCDALRCAAASRDLGTSSAFA